HAFESVAGEFVRVADPGPEFRVVRDQRLEEFINGGHGGTFVLSPGQNRNSGFGGAAQRQRVIPLQRPALLAVFVQLVHRQVQLLRFDPEWSGMFIEQLPGSGIHAWTTRQRQIVRCVFSGAKETIAFYGLGDAVGYANRVAGLTLLRGGAMGCKSLLHVVHGADKGGGVTAVESYRIKAPVLQVLFKPFQALAGTQLGSLFDAPAIGNHHRQDKAAVLGTPPSGYPVTAALLFSGAIGEKGYQGFTGQRHMGVLQFRKPEIAAFDNASGGVGV